MVEAEDFEDNENDDDEEISIAWNERRRREDGERVVREMETNARRRDGGERGVWRGRDREICGVKRERW